MRLLHSASAFLLLAVAAGCSVVGERPSHIYLRTRTCVDNFTAMKIVLKDSANRSRECMVTDPEVIENVREKIQESSDEPLKFLCRNSIVLICGRTTFSICYGQDVINYQGATARADGIDEVIDEYLATLDSKP